MIHSEEMIDGSRDTFLSISKNCGRATCFYKATNNSPEKHGWNLVVVMEEEGIDAAADSVKVGLPDNTDHRITGLLDHYHHP